MEILVFDIFAKYAYFKVPEGTLSNFSFPFPPRTTVIGLIAAIMGEERNKYWLDKQYTNLQVGIEILNTSSTQAIKMNYWRTKSISPIESRSLDMKIMIASGSDADGRGYTNQVKFDYLTDVAYRIYVSDSSDLFVKLKEKIEKKEYYYPPYFGHANLLAEVQYVGIFDGKPIIEGNISTIIPSSKIKKECKN
ncbi:MAG: type I-B CRISPR-associated protein Cas5b [Candidatus Heimdallarchaeota archaeon]|nr:type I-B CRISPR-associated protein Cas5b [Candidatus Heimdallarchaeota archaeon]